MSDTTVSHYISKEALLTICVHWLLILSHCDVSSYTLNDEALICRFNEYSFNDIEVS